MSTARSSPAPSALGQPAELADQALRGPSIDCAVYMLDSAGNVATWNSVAERMTGYRADEIIGRHVSLLYPAEEVSAGVPQRHLQRALAQGRCEEEVQRLRRDGSPCRMVVSVSAQFDRMNAHSGFAVAMNEVRREPTHGAVDSSTLDNLAREQAHQHAERKLHSEKLFSDAMIESMPGVFYFYDAAGRFLRWNRNLERVSGYSAQEVARMHPLDFFADQTKALLEQRIAEVFETGESSVEVEFVARDGSLKPYYFTGRRLDFEGAPCVVGVGIDISERKSAENRLAESERKYRELVEHANSIIVRWNSDGRITFLNEFGQRFFGYSAEEIHGRNAIGTIVPPTESGGRDLQQLIQDIGANPAAFEQNLNENMRRNGERVWISWTNRIVRDSRGRVAEILSIGHDVTERKRTREQLEQTNRDLLEEIAERKLTEAALRESEERFRELAETIQEVFWMTDPLKKRVLYVSPAYEKIWGRSCASLYASPRSRLETLHPDDRERVVDAVRSKQERGDYDETYRIVRPDGAVRWIRERAFPVRAAAGEIVRVVGTAEDITERRELEEQVQQAQKIEAIGQLAAGVAHDFNNVLAAILGNTRLALDDTAQDHPAHESLQEIKKAGIRGRSLVQQILAFGRHQPHERRVIELGPTLQEAFGLLRVTIPSLVELSVSIDATAPPVLADPTQVYQVIANLCTNAWHALEDRPGRIEITLESVTVDAEAASRIAGLRPGRFACLRVTDNGKGMDAATLKRIYDPFFTTKGPGKGTGLGLPFVHAIVREHEGAIDVTSQPGCGTTFRVYLPAAATPSAPPAPLQIPHRGEGQHILYLDDEESLVFLAVRMLERLGYHVSGFTSAADAIRAFHQRPGQFDLVITDLNMPGASGLHIAEEILKIRPDVPVVLCSGYVTEELRAQADDIGIRNVLYKPNTMQELSEAIHRVASEAKQPETEPDVGRSS